MDNTQRPPDGPDESETAVGDDLERLRSVDAADAPAVAEEIAQDLQRALDDSEGATP